MNVPEGDQIRRTLQRAMPDDLSPAVAEGMQSRMDALRRRFETRASVVSISPTDKGRRGQPLRWVAVTVAAAVLLVTLFSVLRTWNSVAWGAVLEAIAGQPCLHYVTTHDDGTRIEGWFSAPRAVLICQTFKAGTELTDENNSGLVMIDYSENTEDWFDRENNLIVRTTSEPFREGVSLFETFFSAMLSDGLGHPIDAERATLVPQRQQAVTKGNRRWIEYHFSLKSRNEEARPESQWIVSVDPGTRLPFRWQQIDHDPHAPKVACVRTFNVDYPASYPADLHALGAPKTAKLVDRTLRSDVEALVAETVAPKYWAACKFSALVVESSVDQQWWQGSSIHRVWNDGLRWRVEHSMGPVTQPRSAPPAADTDPKSWWIAKAQRLPFRPIARCDGKWYWRYQTETRQPTPADTAGGWPENTTVIASIVENRDKPVRKDQFQREYPLSCSGHLTNPFVSPLPLFPGFESAVDPEPESGPTDTVLLEVRNPYWNPGNHPPHENPQIWRLWIDPARDYLVMRTEQLTTRNGEETIVGGYSIEELTQDPEGRWHPTVVRRLRTNYSPADIRKEGFLRFYYDFSSPIPPEVFGSK